MWLFVIVLEDSHLIFFGGGGEGGTIYSLYIPECPSLSPEILASPIHGNVSRSQPYLV